MRFIPLAALVLLAGCGNIPGYPPKQAQDDACFIQTVKEASGGDFSNWVLPVFVPGKHLVVGQAVPCMAK